jgi:hypothetical protein
VIQRQSQTSEYWSAYAFTPDDAEFLYGFVLEAGRPKRAEELAAAIVRHRFEQENAVLRRQLDGERLYQPKKTYEVGASVVFPALQFAPGQVVGLRKGNNPELGEFVVIVVKMADGSTREFAANYDRPHRLNDGDVATMFQAVPELSPEDVYAQHGQHVAQVLSKELEKNPEFIRIADEWFLRAMMAEVNVGHLNLAEAVLDMSNGGPLTTDVILRDLGLPPDVTDNVQEASLNNALAADNRFDDVSLDDQPSWFLRRLEPAEVRGVPAPLHAVRFPGSTTINEELATLAGELDDELEFGEDARVEPADRTAVVLTFPHRRAGTLGWSRRVASVLPDSPKPRLPIRMKDRATGAEMTVWLVRDGRYIWGLADWFKANDLPAGAYIELSRASGETVTWIDYRRRRPKREWVRVASSRDSRLHLETAQRAVACDVDELMSVFVDDPRTLDTVRGDRPRELAPAVRDAFPEIAKLSPQGNVHARTLYSIANLITRGGPRDVFAALTASGAYVPVGDNYWHLGER